MYVHDWFGPIRPESRHPYVHRVGILVAAVSLSGMWMVVIVGLLC